MVACLLLSARLGIGSAFLRFTSAKSMSPLRGSYFRSALFLGSDALHGQVKAGLELLPEWFLMRIHIRQTACKSSSDASLLNGLWLFANDVKMFIKCLA